MSNSGLTVSVTLTGNNKQLIDAVEQSRVEIDKLGASTGKTSMLASQLSGMMSGQSDELSKSASQVQKLLDRYDPLGAKLQRLKTDFESLSAAAGRGHVAAIDDNRTDTVYAKLKNEIAATEAALTGVGPAAGAAFREMAAGAEKGMFSTAQARRELIVLGHEAMMGNFSRMPGSFMVLAERASSAGVSLMGIAAPIIAVGAAAFVMAKAVSDGEAEMNAMNRAMEATGDYAGVTRGQMRDLASSMADYGSITIGQSKGIVTQLVASGRIGGDALRSVTSLVSDFASVTGQDVAKVGPQLVKLFEDPAKGAEQLNQSMHFLSAAEIEHIASLQRMGETEKAQIELADQLKSKIQGEAESLGGLAGVLDSVKKSASEMWDSLMAVGRPDTIEQKIAKAQSELAASYASSMPWSHTSDAQSKLDELLAMKAKQDSESKKKAADAAVNERNNSAWKLIEGKSTSYQAKSMQDQLALISGATVGGGLTQQMKDEAIRSINQEIASAREKSSGMGSGRAQSSYIKAEQDATYKAQHESLLRQQEDLDRSLKGQLISYQDYYGKKRALEQRDAQLKISGITTGIGAAEKSFGSASTPDQKWQAKARLATLQGELNKATEDYGRIAPKVAQLADVAFKKLQDKVDAINAKMLAAQGNVSESFAVTWQKANGDTIKTLQRNASGTGPQSQLAQADLGVMDKARSQSEVDAQLKELSTKFSRTLSDMADAEKRISIDQQAGFLTKYQAQDQLKTLRTDTVPKLQSDLAPASGLNLSTDAQKKQVEALKLQIDQVTGSVSELNRTFEYGATTALGGYLDKISNAADQSSKFVSDSFNGMENALTNFVTHGKLDFNTLADTIVSDLLRIEVEKNIMQPMASALNSSGSSIFSSIGSLLGLGSSTPAAATPSAAVMSSFSASSPLFSASAPMIGVGGFHSGGNPAVDGATFTRYVHPAYFENAPRFHSGIGPGEMPAIIQPSESVLTPGQMRQLAPVSSMSASAGPVNVTINVTGAPSTPKVQQSQAAGGGMQIDVIFDQVDNYIASGIKTGNGATSMAIAQTFGADRSAGAVR